MLVSHLISRLQEADPEMPVVMARDEEGNGFRHLGTVEIDNNVFTSDYEVSLHHLTPELEAEGYAEEDVGEGPRVVVLW